MYVDALCLYRYLDILTGRLTLYVGYQIYLLQSNLLKEVNDTFFKQTKDFFYSLVWGLLQQISHVWD